MDAYEQMLDDLARSNSDSIISNGNDGHATALIAKLFEVARKSVNIFTGPQDVDIYTDSAVLNAAARFLQQENAQLKIILDKDTENEGIENPSNNKFLVLLHNKLGDSLRNKVIVYPADDEAARIPYHYILIDDNAFRFEPNKKVHEALASFNNKPAAGFIKASFEKLRDRLTPAQLNIN